MLEAHVLEFVWRMEDEHWKSVRQQESKIRLQFLIQRPRQSAEEFGSIALPLSTNQRLAFRPLTGGESNTAPIRPEARVSLLMTDEVETMPSVADSMVSFESQEWVDDESTTSILQKDIPCDALLSLQQQENFSSSIGRVTLELDLPNQTWAFPFDLSAIKEKVMIQSTRLVHDWFKSLRLLSSLDSLGVRLLNEERIVAQARIPLLQTQNEKEQQCCVDAQVPFYDSTDDQTPLGVMDIKLFLRPHQTSNQPQPIANEPWHQFRLGIDLKSLHTPQFQPSHVYCTYQFDSFTSKAPISTLPPILTGFPTRDQVLPNSFNAWEFVMSRSQLHHFLAQEPLMIQLWYRDEESRDTCFASTVLNIASVMTNGKQRVWQESPKKGRFPDSAGRPIMLQTLDRMYDMLWVEDTLAFDREKGKHPEWASRIRVVLSLEDFGQIEDDNEGWQEKEEGKGSSSTIQSQQMELEDEEEIEHVDIPGWVKEEQLAYLKELRHMEADWKSSIQQIFTHRLLDRLKPFEEQMESMVGVEESLLSFLNDLTIRESKLSLLEDEVKMHDSMLENRSRRQIEQYQLEKQVDLFQNRTALQNMKKHREELTVDVEAVNQQVTQLQRAAHDLQHQIDKVGGQQVNQARWEMECKEKKLRTEVEQLRNEIRLTEGSCLRYKAQWTQAVQNLQTLRDDIEHELEERVSEERNQLASLQLQSLLHREKENDEADRRALDDIRKQLKKLSNGTIPGISAPAGWQTIYNRGAKSESSK